jgi:signal transduction histidine kinase
MDGLAAELLASARLDFDAVEQHEVDPVALCRRALERGGHDAGLLDSEGETTLVRGDATLLLRAVANLLDNAVRHGGGLVGLRVVGGAGRVRIEADDSGAGFADDEAAERAFEPFRREGGQGAGGGLGLGLSLVRRIAEAHGGRAYAENRPEEGARVGIELPVAPSGAA